MARTKAAPPQTRRANTPYLLIAGIFLALAAIGALLFLTGLLGQGQGQGGTAADSDEVSIQYTTEKGDGAAEGVVNSPLKVEVRIPWSQGAPDTALSAVTLQIVDEAGNPAEYGGTVPEPFGMKPTFDISVWDYDLSVPSKPGTYYARVHLQSLYDKAKTQDLELKGVRLKALPETSPPITSGYAFVSDSNLWVLSADTTRQRRLTYFSSAVGEYTDTPTWSPDGKQIAFTYAPKAEASEIPSTEIWTVAPDGSGLRQLVAHGQGESLFQPAWSGDGKYLYFTMESATGEPSAYDPAGAPIYGRRIDRMEVATGARSEWAALAQMPASGGKDSSMLYLQYVRSEDGDPSAPLKQRLMKANGGSDGTVLVGDDLYPMMQSPAMSPDGKWVAFAAVNPIVPLPAEEPSNGGFDFFRWLLFEPGVAEAHGQPWDIYVVPATGGAPIRITTLDEDEPDPYWLDNTTIGVMGITGLYKQTVDPSSQPAGKPAKIHRGAPHGGLTWHAP